MKDYKSIENKYNLWRVDYSKGLLHVCCGTAYTAVGEGGVVTATASLRKLRGPIASLRCGKRETLELWR